MKLYDYEAYLRDNAKIDNLWEKNHTRPGNWDCAIQVARTEVCHVSFISSLSFFFFFKFLKHVMVI